MNTTYIAVLSLEYSHENNWELPSHMQVRLSKPMVNQLLRLHRLLKTENLLELRHFNRQPRYGFVDDEDETQFVPLDKGHLYDEGEKFATDESVVVVSRDSVYWTAYISPGNLRVTGDPIDIRALKAFVKRR